MEFNWSNNVKNTSLDGRDTLFNLENGAYSVTVTDNEGCIASIQNIIVEDIEKLTYTANINQISCPDFEDGLIQLDISGGTEPYRFEWDNGEETSFLFNLGEGFYACTIFDANDCQVSTQAFAIEKPNDLRFESLVHFVEEDYIEVSLDIEGGKAPYNCQWTGNQILFQDECNIVADAPGLIDVRILDDNNCILDTSFLLDISTNSYAIDFAEEKLLNNNIGHDLISIKPLDYYDFVLMDYTGHKIKADINQNAILIHNLRPGIYIVAYKINNHLRTERFIKI